MALAGVVVGSLLTIAQQAATRSRDRTERERQELRAACADFITACEVLRNRIWEEREGLAAAGDLSGWNVHAHRRAFAELELRVTDLGLREALLELRQAGLVLDRAWRASTIERPDFTKAWDDYQNAIARFSTAARELLAK